MAATHPADTTASAGRYTAGVLPGRASVVDNHLLRWSPRGAGDRSRTRDILITSEALYQLSYTGETATPDGQRTS